MISVPGTGKARRDKLREMGLCLRCKAPATPGTPLCPDCRALQTADMRVRREEWRAKGRCGTCGLPCDGATCERCNDACTARKLGVTRQEVEQARRAKVCAICGTDTPRGKGRFHVDHDHVTGQIRGVLCHPCNVGLGHFNDDPGLLEAAARYVREHRTAAPKLDPGAAMCQPGVTGTRG